MFEINKDSRFDTMERLLWNISEQLKNIENKLQKGSDIDAHSAISKGNKEIPVSRNNSNNNKPAAKRKRS